jgi:hypothetical protein
MDRVCIRNVHHQRHKTVPELALQTIGVGLLADRTKHAKSLRNKNLSGSPSNSTGHPSDYDIFAVRHRISPENCSSMTVDARFKGAEADHIRSYRSMLIESVRWHTLTEQAHRCANLSARAAYFLEPGAPTVAQLAGL